MCSCEGGPLILRELLSAETTKPACSANVLTVFKCTSPNESRAKTSITSGCPPSIFMHFFPMEATCASSRASVAFSWNLCKAPGQSRAISVDTASAALQRSSNNGSPPLMKQVDPFELVKDLGFSEGSTILSMTPASFFLNRLSKHFDTMSFLSISAIGLGKVANLTAPKASLMKPRMRLRNPAGNPC